MAGFKEKEQNRMPILHPPTRFSSKLARYPVLGCALIAGRVFGYLRKPSILSQMSDGMRITNSRIFRQHGEGQQTPGSGKSANLKSPAGDGEEGLISRFEALGDFY